MKITCRLGAALLLGFIGHAAAQGVPETEMKSILAEFDGYLTATDPIRAEQRGDLAALPLWPDESPQAIAGYRATLLDIQQRLNRLAGARLSAEDALNRDLLLERVYLDLTGFDFDEARIAINTGDGFFTVPAYAADGVILRSETEARAWIRKIAALPAYYAIEIENMRRGIKSGWVRPRLVAQTVTKALRTQADLAPESHTLLRPLAALPKSVPAEVQARLRAEALQVVKTQVKPAERAAAEFMEREYVPRSATTIGIVDLPADGNRTGLAYYDYVIRRHASTRMSPQEIHQLGLREVARIRKEMEALLAGIGFKGSFAEFTEFLRSDPQFRARDVDDFTTWVRDLAKQVDALLPQYFRTLPRLTYGVRKVPPEMKDSSSGYNPGSPEQGVAGTVLINPDAPEHSPMYGVPAWFVHEGVPGHHLQIALAQERFDLPKFRRSDDINAYVEGWALYSEHLAVEMGVYRTPYEDFGRLSLEMWRACRLVVDPGMHAMGWPREQAVAYLRDNTALSQATIDREIDRYIGWPAQALGYKIGEIRFRELRAKAEAALGPKFDVRDFHDAILVDGPMPLDILEAQVARWIKSRQ
jgi:uncharacterized protein (DUF885 family)